MIENASVILSTSIPNWKKCFNCVFAHKRKSRYICHLKWYIKKYVEKQPTRFRDPAFFVKKTDCCEHIITRPPYCTELYGDAVILYPFKEGGVKKFNLTGEFLSLYEPKLRALQKKLGLKILPKFNTGYSWTFSSSSKYALKRNQLMHNGELKGKFTCNYCKKKFYYSEVEVHHIMERTNGGSDTTGNLMILCILCHSLETWKLVTNNSEITDELKWRKVIESRLKVWEKWQKLALSRYERLQSTLIAYQQFPVNEEEEELNGVISVGENRTKESIVVLKRFLDRCNRKMGFWQKYEKKTRKWIYNKKTYGIKKVPACTIDQFLKKI